MRLLNLARLDGIKYHVFVSTPVLKIFPAAIEAVLGDLHDLDWLKTTPQDSFEEAQSLALRFQHRFEGTVTLAPEIPLDKNQAFNPQTTRLPNPEDFLDSSPTDWLNAVETTLREDHQTPLTLRLRPQVLNHVDPSLTKLRQIIQLAKQLGYPNRTLRELNQPQG